MASQIVESYRSGAEICHGDALCKKRLSQLLEEIGLPNGLFAVDDIQEFGFNGEAGFIWLIQRKKKDHTFKKIKRTVSYGPEVTAFVEKGKIKNITGVKTKELMLWFTVVETYVEDPSSGKITFKSGTGFTDSFPVSAFKSEE